MYEVVGSNSEEQLVAQARRRPRLLIGSLIAGFTIMSRWWQLILLRCC